MRVEGNKQCTFSRTIRRLAQETTYPFRQELSRDDIQKLHSTYGVIIPDTRSLCTVVPPAQNSKSLSGRFLYCIKDCSLSLWDIELKFDFYSARELLTQEDKLPKSLTQETEQKLDIEQEINNETPANHLKTHLERIIEHALNYEDSGKQTEAISAIYNAAKKGKKIIFVSAHGDSCEGQWGLDLYNVPYLIPTNEILSEISHRHTDEAALIYINSCNPDNLPVEENKITLPVVRHTDTNSPSYSPVKLHLCL